MKKLILGVFLLSSVYQLAAQNSGLQARLRIISVIPDESATIEAIGGDVTISTSYVPDLNFTYFLSNNWAAELVLAVSPHNVDAVGTAAGDIDLGKVWLLPPTLSLQYFFADGGFKPYLGASVNLTIFFGVDDGPTADKLSYDTAVGYGFQAGFDYMLNETWFVNFDFKKLFINTNVTVDATTALGAVVGADVDINPYLIGVGIGKKF